VTVRLRPTAPNVVVLTQALFIQFIKDVMYNQHSFIIKS
jgi:hypothetical protein